MIDKMYPICMEISGNTAMWTRPDSGDAPCSYPAPTYSAVRAMFESVLWGPAIKILPIKVEICAPIHYHSYVINYAGPLRKADSIRKGNQYQLYATVLTDVCYRLYANVVANPEKHSLTQKAREWERSSTSPAHAYQAIFNRRIFNSQSFASLCLGWKEFAPSYFGPFRQETRVCESIQNLKIPSMLREVFPDGYNSGYRAIYDSDVEIINGVLLYPGTEAAKYDQ